MTTFCCRCWLRGSLMARCKCECHEHSGLVNGLQK